MHVCMHACMYGWMDGWMDECMDGWMHEWVHVCMVDDGRMGRRTGDWVHDGMAGWMTRVCMYGWMDGWMDECMCVSVAPEVLAPSCSTLH